MPGPVYSKKWDTSGIDVLRSISNAFRVSLSAKKSQNPQCERQHPPQKASKSYLLLLLKRLGDESSTYEERAQSAVEVRQLLNTFEVESIPALWYSAHDLIDCQVPEPTRRVALELLHDCIMRCEEGSLKVIFFHVIVDHIINLLEEEKRIEMDNDMALFLSCLNLTLEDSALRSEEVMILTTILDDLTSLGRRQNATYISPGVVLELMILIRKLVKPAQESTIEDIVHLMRLATKEKRIVEKEFFDEVLDFTSFITKDEAYNVSKEIFHEIMAILIGLSEQLHDQNVIQPSEKFLYLLQIIAASAQSLSFFNQLFVLNKRGVKGSDEILGAYAPKFFAELANSSTLGDQSKKNRTCLITLNKLYRNNNDNILQEALLAICRCNKTETTVDYKFWLSTGDILGIWPLIKLTFERSPQGNTNFGQNIINILLELSPRILPISVEELLQYSCDENIPVQHDRIIAAVEMQTGDNLTHRTLHLLVTIIMKPNNPIGERLMLWQFILKLIEKPRPGILLTRVGHESSLSLIFSLSEALEMNKEERALFGYTIYALIQALEVDQCEIFVRELILTDIHRILGILRRRKSIVGAISTFGRSMPTTELLMERLNEMVKGLVKGFIWSVTDNSGFKCVLLYEVLIQIYEYAERCSNSKTLLNIARAMVRIRCDLKGHFYFKNPSDADGISSAFGRNKNQMKASDDSLEWTYPEKVSIIDEVFLEKCNTHVSFTNCDENECLKVDMGPWLSVAIGTIESPPHLEIYSYLLTHLCAQLSELRLFQPHWKSINRFKRVICDHLINAIPSNVLSGENIGRSNLHSAYVRNLSAVLAYYPYQARSFADELISALVGGLTSWEKTLIPILHILTVSCFEIPHSIQRYLTPILLHLQKRITSLYAIPSILEFFDALGDSPKLISNLTLEEIKRVFAIIFKIIESSVDLKIRSQLEENAGTDEGKTRGYIQFDYEVDMSPSTESFSIRESLTNFFQYQTFRALSFWYLRLNENCKLKLTPFIMKNLEDLSSIECLKYDAIAYTDFFKRSRFGPQKNGLTIAQVNTLSSSDSFEETRWIHGYCLISIRIAGSKELATITIRKPSCNRTFDISHCRQITSQSTYNIYQFPDKQEIKEFKRPQTLAYSVSQQILLQLLYVGDLSTEAEDAFMEIPDEPAFNRSISTFDRIPDVEFQKAGIIYIGPSQHNESEVLSNKEGSHQYRWFLNEMGSFIKLNEVSRGFYTGGLDPGVDGEYALIWSDEVTQIAFHTLTLMPDDNDISLKKRHVGNDLVNIFYDESGLPNFNFNIIKSQFTSISIVISPQNNGEKDTIAEHYKVKAYRRTGTPGLLSCTHFKIIRKPNLARYVRHICMVANALAQKYYENHSSDACSIWGIRCKHLEMLRERVISARNTNSS